MAYKTAEEIFEIDSIHDMFLRCMYYDSNTQSIKVEKTDDNQDQIKMPRHAQIKVCCFSVRLHIV